MAAIGEDLLKLHIKEKKFSPVYIFYGDDDYFKKYYLGKIKQKAVGDDLPEFNLHELDGNKADINDIIEVSMVMPMMSDYALAVVYDFDFSTVKSEKIEELFNGLCDENILLFYYRSMKPNQQKAAWKKVMKLIKEQGSVVQFSKKDSRELAKIAMSAAKKKGCFMPQYLASKFIERVGDDLNLVLNEINKLCAMKGEGEITAEDIDAISVKTLDASAFDLSKELLNGNAAQALSILHELIEDQHQEPIMVLAALHSAYIDMYRVKLAMEKGLDCLAVANFYTYKADWRLKRAAFNAKKLSLSQLRRCINALAQADKGVKSTSAGADIILDELVVKLLLICAGR